LGKTVYTVAETEENQAVHTGIGEKRTGEGETEKDETRSNEVQSQDRVVHAVSNKEVSISLLPHISLFFLSH
jgi:hypothetical protein